MPVQRIYKWRRASKDGLMGKSKAVATEESSSEVKQLRKALKEKELELKILKKAVHIFSKNDGKSTSL